MKLSAFIAELQEALAEHGDVEVLVPNMALEDVPRKPGYYADPDIDVLPPDTHVETWQPSPGCRCGMCSEWTEFRERPIMVLVQGWPC